MRQNLFEGFSQQEIDCVMGNIKRNLQQIAFYQKNSHAFKQHADKTDAYLQRRMLVEKRHAVTSYYSAQDAKEATLKALEFFWDRKIQNFLLSTDDRCELFFDTKESIGYGYINGIYGVFEDCHKICVVLQKDPDCDWGFFILTTYPIITKDLVADTTI